MSAEIAEVAVPYAILALYDGKVAITADNILKILDAANISVERVWAEVFARAFSDPAKIETLILSLSTAAASAPVAAAPAQAATPAAAPAAAAKEAPKKKEESEEEMGFGLFD